MKASPKLALAAALAAAGLGYALPGQAHHAFATEFDSAKPLVVEGTVTRARLVNPHSWIYLDVKNPDGTVTNWGFEFGTPLSLKAHGIERADVAFGSKIRLSGFRAKNGGAFGYAAVVAFADGRQVAIGSAPDAPALAIR
jgi:hypothetical protein